MPFRYQGQYYDNEVDLCYNRFRYYDPNSGNYISQDPIRLAGGNPTLYGYVEDPNVWIDEFGLDCKNKNEGLRRESTLRQVLEEIYGKNKVLRERILLDSNGNKITDRKNKGRRIDFIILNNDGEVVKSIEVTSKTAKKKYQMKKEQFIRNKGEINGGTYVKDTEGNLIRLPHNLNTKIIRLK